MEFKKYMHVERLGNEEVRNIEMGICYIFPKIDGTNASVWLNKGIVKAGSRNRMISIGSDNAGFSTWISEQENITKYLLENPKHRLYGEYLIPHSLKTYNDNAWEKFYVFDVAVDREPLHSGDDRLEYLHYDYYKPLLEKHNIEYIPPTSIIENGSYEQFVKELEKNDYLIQNGCGIGEGLVIKNYDYRNRANRTVWAKLVTSEFKTKNRKEMGASNILSHRLLLIKNMLR